MKKLVGLFALLLAAGCGGGGATTQRRPAAAAQSMLRTTGRTGMPPAGATMVGMMSNPTVGSTGVTVPVTGVVYTFMADLTGSGTAVAVFFVYDATNMKAYFWSAFAGTCQNGGAATLDFLLEVNADGSGGYILGATGCSAETATGGCTFDASGNEGTCGACAVTATSFACVAATSGH